jgi:hypothetical protein
MATGSEINGRVLRDLRRIRLMEQLDLANAACVIDPGCELSREDISAYERGVKHPTARKLGAILRALHNATVLGKPMHLSNADVRALIATPSLDAALPAKQEDNMDRRNLNLALAVLMGEIGASVGLGELGEAIERIAAGAKYPVDEGLITSHERIAITLAQEHHKAKPAVLLAVVGAAADRVLEDLDRHMTGTQRDRLYAVAAGMHAQAGALAFHAGRWPTAYRYLSTARSVAVASGNPTLHAQALISFANLYHPGARGGMGGNYDETMRLVDQAADVATGHAAGFPLANIHRWRANLYTCTGDAEAAKPSLAVVEQALSQPSGPQHGYYSPIAVYQGMQAQVERTRGLVFAADGRFDDAEQAFHITPSHSAREQVKRLSNLGKVRLGAHAPEGTCDALGDAHGQAVATGYTMGLARIRGLRVRFPRSWNTLACVVALDEQLRTPA